jgi:putative hemolysin
VYYGYQQQIPLCVQEITRLREITFRKLDEGSGKPCDSDKYDATYMHLFIFDHQDETIIGAYRIGQTDLLQKNADKSKLYLSQMFNFHPEFINQHQPCLEMGRSFIVEAHQNSFHGLLLLWKGIGQFICKNPQYRTLYGTVSLSKLYDPRSVALINEMLVKKSKSVTAKSVFNSQLHPEVKEFLNKETITFQQLSALVMAIEKDNKDIPILLKQYSKLGAKFHCMGIDMNFNKTPGLLLSVDLPNAPDKLLNLYLGEGKHDYLNYMKNHCCINS